MMLAAWSAYGLNLVPMQAVHPIPLLTLDRRTWHTTTSGVIQPGAHPTYRNQSSHYKIHTMPSLNENFTNERPLLNTANILPTPSKFA